MTRTLIAAALLAAGFANAAHANMRITEWMYSPSSGNGEFVEFTNMGSSNIDMTGWSYDDDSRTPDTFSLSGFGVVAAGESFIITEIAAATFKTQWGLGNSVKVLGGYTNNLGRADEINLYDNNDLLIDRLTYDDQGSGTIDGPRTQGKSGNPANLGAIGANTANAWVLSSVGDAEGSWTSTTNNIGNPGVTQFAAPVPEADTYAFMALGMGLVGLLARRRRG